MLQQTERDLGDLLGAITHNLERLVKGEIKLVKVGALEWVRGVSTGAILVVVGALLGLLTVGLALASAVAALARTMPLWQAALLVAGGVGVLSIVTVVVGLKAVSPPPQLNVELSTARRPDHGTDNR